MSKPSPREIRESARLPRIVVCVRAGVAECTLRAYENDPVNGVTPRSKAKIDPVYAALAKGA
jgi:hypothetical protein